MACSCINKEEVAMVENVMSLRGITGRGIGIETRGWEAWNELSWFSETGTCFCGILLKFD